MTKKELWIRLNNYHFEEIVTPNLWEQVRARFGGADASTKAFAHKLALKQDWNTRFALRAVLEYKRFVYLGIVGDFVVTPSEVIDVVWHQHILFSKAYRQFCATVIEHDFDHTPELLPMYDQTGIFSAQYDDTLELYKQEFGYAPPVPVWGRPKFDEKSISSKPYHSKKKKAAVAGGDGEGYYGDVPLCESFDTTEGETFGDFGGFDGGDAGGGGAGGSWGESDSDSSGGDGGSCSSCSSGCGGGD